jgi:hypothetical protein
MNVQERISGDALVCMRSLRSGELQACRRDVDRGVASAATQLATELGDGWGSESRAVTDNRPLLQL